MTTTTNDAMPPPKAAAAKRALSETQENASERPEQSKRARLRRPHLPPPPSIAPHPLGIRPLGNLPFAKQEPGFVDTRASGLGTRTFARLDDEFVLAFVVNYLDPRSLCALAGTSRAWMAFWEYDEIWKGWVLEHWRDQPTKPKRFAASTGLWRHTYAMAVRPTYHPKPWTPVHAHHMHSDLLYQAHLNAVTPLAHAVATLDALTDMGVFRRLDTVDRPTADQFRARYEEPSVPVVLRGCMTTWSALRDWEWTKLEAAAGQVPLRAEAIDMTLSEYLAYLRTAPPDEAPVYLFDKDYPRQGEAGAKLAAAFAVPEYFTADLFSVLGPTRPDFSWLIIGPERSGSSHHKDPNLTAAWNAVVRGKKLWVMYPPDLVPPGVYPSDDGAEVTTPNSVSEWFRTWLPLTRQLVKGVPREGRPLWGICGEGEIMFVPHGWWHAVINLEPSIALTQNYVGKHNLYAVLEFLHRNRDQVSGYGNADDAVPVVSAFDPIATAQDGAEKPVLAAPSSSMGSGCVDSRMLYENFVAGLRKHRATDPEIMRTVDQFEAQVAAAADARARQAPVQHTASLWGSLVQDGGGDGEGAGFSFFG